VFLHHLRSNFETRINPRQNSFPRGVEKAAQFTSNVLVCTTNHTIIWFAPSRRALCVNRRIGFADTSRDRLRNRFRAVRHPALWLIMSASFATTTSPNPWSRILDALEKKVNRHSYDTWLKPLRYSHTTGATLFVRVPAPEFREMGERYADLIREAIENLGLEIKDVEFIIAEDSPAAATAIRHNGGFAPPAAGPAPQQARFDFDSAAQLNQRYTFDAFVSGSGNQFAHAAALAVAERPSKAYNPLFLYGGVGMGKTHLMQAIGHQVKQHSPDFSICYVSSEKFTNELINSIKHDRMTSFRERFRNVDLLLIDDIQFLTGKERT